MTDGWIERRPDWLGDQRREPRPDQPPPPPPDDGSLLTVVYHIIRCPHKNCGTDRTTITRTMRPIRYHQCHRGHNFKSVEE